LESGERRGNKNSNHAKLKLGYFKKAKNIPRIFQNMPIIVKTIGPISVGCIGHKILKMAMNLKWSH
jgi:hypothetical protein